MSVDELISKFEGVKPEAEVESAIKETSMVYFVLDTSYFIKAWKENPYAFLSMSEDSNSRSIYVTTPDVIRELERQRDQGMSRRGEDGRQLTPHQLVNAVYTAIAEGRLVVDEYSPEAKIEEEIMKTYEAESASSRIGKGDIASVGEAINLVMGRSDIAVVVSDDRKDVVPVVDALSRKYKIVSMSSEELMRLVA